LQVQHERARGEALGSDGRGSDHDLLSSHALNGER
jgi:hypothetical protein